MPESNNKRKNGKIPTNKVPQGESKRDQFLREANDIRTACLQLIGSASSGMSSLIKAAHADTTIKLDESKVGALADRLANDLSALKIELDNIVAQSDTEIKTLTHNTDEIQVMNVTVEVAQRYNTWQDRFVNLTGPTMEEITELCGGAGDDE